MTDTAIDKAQAEPFWARVRTALGALRPEGEPAYGQAAIARSIGIRPKLGLRIEEELVAGWSQAAGRHVSLCLLVIEIDRFADYFAAYGPDQAEQCRLAMLEAIRANLPRSDIQVLRLGPAGFVLVLPDLPALMARAMAARITQSVLKLALPHKESHAGSVTISIGLAVTNPQGNYDRKFFEAGAEALKQARRKGLGRLHGVDLRPAQERRRRAA